LLFGLVLDKDANKTVHALVLVLFFVFVHVKLFAKKTVPITLELRLRSLANHLALHLDGLVFV
jgi:hypothetical protein